MDLDKIIPSNPESILKTIAMVSSPVRRKQPARKYLAEFRNGHRFRLSPYFTKPVTRKDFTKSSSSASLTSLSTLFHNAPRCGIPLRKLSTRVPNDIFPCSVSQRTRHSVQGAAIACDAGCRNERRRALSR